MTVKAVKRASKIRVDVNPNLTGKRYWKFKVQRLRKDGSWKTYKKTYRTKGKRETRTVNKKKGTYRIWVKPRYKHAGSLSDSVTLRR